MADFNGEVFQPVPFESPGVPTEQGEIWLPDPLFIEGSPGAAACTMTYYHQGFYAAGSVFEYWESDLPGAPPPSGHTLLDIVFVLVVD